MGNAAKADVLESIVAETDARCYWLQAAKDRGEITRNAQLKNGAGFTLKEDPGERILRKFVSDSGGI